MAIPEYIQALRKKVGNDLLLLPAVGAIVFNKSGQVLLQRRADTGKWHAPGGIMEPNESPADAVIREVLEETGVEIEPLYVCGIYQSGDVVYENGDCVQSIIVYFASRAIRGEARVNDDESLEVRYFDQDDLPELRPDIRARIEHAITGIRDAYFKPPAAEV